jgi:hypothetical protein
MGGNNILSAPDFHIVPIINYRVGRLPYNYFKRFFNSNKCVVGCVDHDRDIMGSHAPKSFGQGQGG